MTWSITWASLFLSFRFDPLDSEDPSSMIDLSAAYIGFDGRDPRASDPDLA